MIRKILVPVDGSAFAESVLPLALRLGEKLGAEVRLAMASEPTNLPPGLWAEAFLENHAAYLESITQTVCDRVGPTASVSSVLLEGEVPAALCGEVEASGSDLVVMSTHGHGGLTRAWLGSVADAVLRECPVPVLLVRPVEDESGDASAPGDVSRIVVPIDGTPLSEAAIGPALDMARLFAAPVTLLRTVSYPVMISSYLPDTVDQNSAFVRQAEEEAELYLRELLGRIDHLGVPMDSEVLVSAGPAEGVLEYVEERRADLVVMASRNRHGLTRAVLGSIADKVIRGSHCPVLIVHPTHMAAHARAEEVA